MGFLIKKDDSCLFLRLPNYKNYNSIDEHINKINEIGYVWMVKLGRTPSYSFLNQFIKDGGNLILKSSPKNGNKYYYFKVASKEPLGKLEIPDYYYDLFENEGYDIDMLKKNYLWLKLISYKEISKEIVDNFVTISKGKPLSNSIMNSRAPQVYAKANINFEI